MKAKVYDWIKTTVDVPGFVIKRIIPKGTEGTIIEAYNHPREGYAVDLAIPDDSLVGGFKFDNVILHPDQFTVLDDSSNSESGNT